MYPSTPTLYFPMQRQMVWSWESPNLFDIMLQDWLRSRENQTTAHLVQREVGFMRPSPVPLVSFVTLSLEVCAHSLSSHTDPTALSATPKVKGFSFVDALPTPRAATIDPQSLQDLMTWGTIESTPIALRSTAALARSSLGGGGGPFKIVDTTRREVLAHKMAVKAKKSLSQRAGGSANIGIGGLRRNVLDRSVRGEGDRTPRTPSSRGGVDLSPAAKMLLGRTGPGSAIHKGMSSNSDYEAEEESWRKLERARIRAREVESRERLKRARWSASPTLSLGFDPDLP